MSDPKDATIDSLAGWVIVALGFVTLLLVWGTVFTFTVYEAALADAFGLSSIRASSVFSATIAAFYIVGGGLGILIARLPLRPVVVTAAVGIGVAVGLLQVVGSYPGLLAAFGLLGAASGAVFVIVVSLVPQWFDAYEGRAIGVTMTGNGLGVLVMPFAWIWLLDRVDIRGAFAAVGAVIVVTLLLASLAYRRPPGLRGAADTTAVDPAWLRSQFADRRFLAALAGFALLWSWYFMVAGSLVDVLTRAGIARSLAATAFGLIGGISVVTRLAGGAVGDWVGLRITMTVGVALAALGVFALVFVSSPVGMYTTLFVFGIGLGVAAALFSPIVVGRFGPEHATAVVGLFTVAEASTALLTPVAASAAVEVTGGYSVPLVVLGAVTLVGAWLFYWGTAPDRGSGAERA